MNRIFNKNQLISYVNLVSSIVETKDSKKVSNELRDIGINIKSKNVKKILEGDNLKKENNKLNYSVKMEKLFRDEFKF